VKTLSLLLALLGVAAITGFTVWFGAGTVLHSVLSVGVGGFLLLALFQLASDGLLGLAWRVACPRQVLGASLGRLVFARMMREAGMTCLPFSQLGGIALGIRVTRLGRAAPGAPPPDWPLATAASVVDLTAEVIGQIGFIAAGLLLLLLRRPDSPLASPLGLGILLGVGAVGGFLWAQLGGGRLAGRAAMRLSRHLAGSHARGLGTRLLPAQDGLDALQASLQRFYARPWRVAGGCLLHFAGWLASGLWVWLAYRLLGAHPGPLAALTIEAVASGALSVSFLVPAGLGVQEAAYVSLGSLFGIDPQISLGLSLIRRGRDLAIGAPMLLAWQALELRRLRAARSPAPRLRPPGNPPALPLTRSSPDA